MMLRPLMGTFGDTAGLVPVAMTMMLGARVRDTAARVLDAHGVGVDETGDRRDQLDVVARKLRLGDVDFGLDHVLDAERPGPPW